jgi:PPOX class probable F420-dependent enzyme
MSGTGNDQAATCPGHPLRGDELAFLREARVGRLATVDAHNRPFVVPFCFAVLGEQDPVVVSALDEKPKRVPDRDLARIRNIERNPDVGFVVDRYDEDWSKLAFVQVWGAASLVEPGADRHREAVAGLRAKYPLYLAMAIERRPVIVIEQLRAHSWRGDGRHFS